MRHVLAVAETMNFTRAAERARAEVEATTGAIRGRLTVGAIPTVSAVDFPEMLRDYHLRHPQVRISLRTGSSERFVEQVRDGADEGGEQKCG